LAGLRFGVRFLPPTLQLTDQRLILLQNNKKGCNEFDPKINRKIHNIYSGSKDSRLDEEKTKTKAFSLHCGREIC